MQELLDLYNSDRTAWAASVVKEYGQDVFRFARSIVRDYAKAEDITQKTFINAERFFGSFRGDGSVKGWLLTIASRQACSEARKEKKIREREHRDDIARAGVQLPEDAARAEQMQALDLCIAALSSTDKAIIEWKLDSICIAEIARRLGISRHKVEKRYEEILVVLRSQMRKYAD